MTRRDLDQIDDLEVLETIDWNEDPWDASLGVGEVEQLRGQSRIAKWIGFAAIAVVIVAVLAGGVYGWWYIRQANPAGDPGPVVQFTVVEGDTLRSVSDRLEEEGIVNSAGFFRSYADGHGGLDSVEPGLYLLRPGDHVGNILGHLRTSPSDTTARITFPEGFTLQQMANRLANSEDLPQFDAAAFMTAANDASVVAAFRPEGRNSLEGLLFPATYEISNAETERQVVEKMVAEMERVANSEGITAPPIPGMSPYDVLIVASMIEREAKTDADRPMIARVIYNRLAMQPPMRLNIDATVLYGQNREALAQLGIDLTDLQPGDIDTLQTIDTPWNTYTRDGLPATPIANPGRASIEAALHPARNPSAGEAVCNGVPAGQCLWLYYVVEDEAGNHAFAVTAEQHQANVERARELGLLGG
jgi:UPF0755 protein